VKSFDIVRYPKKAFYYENFWPISALGYQKLGYL